MRKRPSLDYTSTVTDTTYAVQSGDHLIPVDATANDVELELPPLADVTGETFCVKVLAVGSNDVTLTPDGSETIDGASSLVLSAQWDIAWLFAHPDGWLLL